MKRYTDRNRKKTKEYKVEDKVLISTKIFPMKLMKKAIKKLMKKYIGSYMVKKIILENVIELELLTSLKIHLVVNMKKIVKYQEQVERQKKISPPSVEIKRKRKQKVEKILNR